MARVRTTRHIPCSDCTCARRPGPDGAWERTVIASNLIGARQGDQVLLEEPKNSSIHIPSRLLLFFCCLCLAGLFAGALTLAWLAPLSHDDLNAGLGALGGLVCALLIHKYLVAPLTGSQSDRLPVIMRVVSSPHQ